ncbi:MAG: hypothetical protein HFE77_03685 [Clostridiales bacterium]|nr:hypothetical protein [Clostridiales bacterium]
MTATEFLNKLKKVSPVVPILLSVLCAMSLWLYVMSVESPLDNNTFYGVNVELRNETVLQKNSLSVFSGQNTSVNVTLTGKKSLLNRLRAEDLVAYVDVGNITEAGEYGLDIKLDPVDGVTLSGFSVNKVTVFVESMVTKYVPIDSEIIYSGGVTRGFGYSMGTPSILATSSMPEVTTTAISGPSSLVNNVDKARVTPIELGSISSSVTYNAVLQMVDANGQVYASPYITIANPNVTVYFPVVTEKEVDVVPEFTGSFNKDEYSYSVTPAKVKIRGEEAALSTADHITFIVDGKDTDLVGSKQFALAVDNEKIEIVDGTEQVTLTVKKEESKSDARSNDEAKK